VLLDIRDPVGPVIGLGFSAAVRAVFPVARSATVGKDDIVVILPGPRTLRTVRRVALLGPDGTSGMPPVLVSAPVPNNCSTTADDDAADVSVAAAVAIADGPVSLLNPYINPATIQCRMTAHTPMIDVTEYRNEPFIKSDTKPLRRVISGERAPKNAANVLKELPNPGAPDVRAKPERIVELKSGNKKKTNVIASMMNDNTLNVSDAAARFVVLSAIVLNK